MKVGMVCPYSLDVPGGVQNHVRDLSWALHGLGHDVSVLAPVADEDLAPPFVVSAGRAIPVPYNGAVARLSFGPGAMARTRRWLRDGDFDVLHVHDPVTPSVSLMALGLCTGAAVATIHTSIARSRAMAVTEPLVRPAMEKLSARITVSEHAQKVVAQYQGGESVVIPNGLYVEAFSQPRAVAASGGPTLLFLGRFDEPRKGLAVLLEAFGTILRSRPDARLVVAGAGDPAALSSVTTGRVRERVELVGQVSDARRADLLATSDLYVAPNRGGESFGIVLVEAMAAGTPVVASDIAAFATVLDHGRWGSLFRNGDAADLARVVERTLRDPSTSTRAQAARSDVRRYDWSEVAPAVVRVYDAVLGGVP